jgi:hypothetical protein
MIQILLYCNSLKEFSSPNVLYFYNLNTYRFQTHLSQACNKAKYRHQYQWDFKPCALYLTRNYICRILLHWRKLTKRDQTMDFRKAHVGQ